MFLTMFRKCTIVFACYLSGHGKFESLGALGISSVLLGTAGVIGWHAFDILVVGLFTAIIPSCLVIGLFFPPNIKLLQLMNSGINLDPV